MSKTNSETVSIGGRVYSVERNASAGFPYTLRGPRGGEVLGIRNVNSGHIYLLQGSKEMRWYMKDTSGALTVHEK